MTRLSGVTRPFGFRSGAHILDGLAIMVMLVGFFALVIVLVAYDANPWYGLVLLPALLATVVVGSGFVPSEIRIAPAGPGARVTWLRFSRPVRSVPVEQLAAVTLEVVEPGTRFGNEIGIVITEQRAGQSRGGRRTRLLLRDSDLTAVRSGLVERLEPAGVSVQEVTRWTDQTSL